TSPASTPARTGPARRRATGGRSRPGGSGVAGAWAFLRVARARARPAYPKIAAHATRKRQGRSLLGPDRPGYGNPALGHRIAALGQGGPKPAHSRPSPGLA